MKKLYNWLKKIRLSKNTLIFIGQHAVLVYGLCIGSAGIYFVYHPYKDVDGTYWLINAGICLLAWTGTQFYRLGRRHGYREGIGLHFKVMDMLHRDFNNEVVKQNNLRAAKVESKEVH